ncbi:hypothetical protein BJ165DRAFT_1434449 [Panaeolus papilionaceus]|nr:hypothetical protein BJ165DRAFT_1434449 [Panaeolus papilionaceus]
MPIFVLPQLLILKLSESHHGQLRAVFQTQVSSLLPRTFLCPFPSTRNIKHPSLLLVIVICHEFMDGSLVPKDDKKILTFAASYGCLGQALLSVRCVRDHHGIAKKAVNQLISAISFRRCFYFLWSVFLGAFQYE